MEEVIIFGLPSRLLKDLKHLNDWHNDAFRVWSEWINPYLQWYKNREGTYKIEKFHKEEMRQVYWSKWNKYMQFLLGKYDWKSCHQENSA